MYVLSAPMLLLTNMLQLESQQSSTPRSSEEFYRLLLGSPNSSYVCGIVLLLYLILTFKIWIKFMAFYVDLAQLNAARTVRKICIR